MKIPTVTGNAAAGGHSAGGMPKTVDIVDTAAPGTAAGVLKRSPEPGISREIGVQDSLLRSIDRVGDTADGHRVIADSLELQVYTHGG